MDRIRTVLANLREQVDAMSPRDRSLFAGLVALLGLVLVGLFTWSLQSVIDDRASRVVLAKENLGDVQAMAVDLVGLDAKLKVAEAKMSNFKPQLIPTHLEEWAKRASVPLKRSEETGSQVQGQYRELMYTVEVEDASLEGLVKFLYAIETSEFPIEVDTVEFDAKTVRQERSMSLHLELRAYSKEG
ncbi:MAG: hypothetical protein ACON5B_15520 [Myxococcota bacterium]